MKANVKMLLASLFVMLLMAAAGFAAEGDLMAKKTASDDLYDVDTTFVTATMTERNLFEVPANAMVVTSKDISEKNIVTVTDALKELPGIFVDRPKGVADATGEVSIRGFGESDILVLYDGMPLNSAYSGGADWTAVPVENIDRIEVVKGAASSLYGGRAVGGVINIITNDKQSEKIKVRLNASYGSNNTSRLGFSAGQKLGDRFSYFLSYERKYTDGFQSKTVSSTAAGKAAPEGTIGTGLVVGQTTAGKPRYIIGSQGDSGGKIETFNVKLKYDFDEFRNLSYSYTQSRFKYWTDNPETYIFDAAGNPLFEGAVQLPNGKWFNFTESNFTDYDGQRSTDVHSLRYADDKNMFYVTLGMTDTKKSGYATGSKFDPNTPGNYTSYPSRSIKGNILKTWDTSDRNSLTVGLEAQRLEMTRTAAKLKKWGDPDSITKITSVSGGKNDILAFFVQDEYILNDQWKLFLGARYDYYKKYDGYYHLLDKPENNKTYPTASYNEISPKIAVEFSPNDTTSIYASYGHSFNPPNIYQLYRTDLSSAMSGYIANPDLEPEKSNTFEIGIRKKFGSGSTAGLSFYYVKTEDLIVGVDHPTIPNKKWYVNEAEATRKGIDFDLNHKFSDRWSTYLNYSWERVTGTTGQRLYYVPEHILHTGLVYNDKKWRAAARADYVSLRQDPKKVSGVYLAYDEFFIMGVDIGYTFSGNNRITFSVDNLFDKKYYQWYRAPGRTFTLGLQLEF